jgi:alpha-1,2-mannosyltransferase
LAVSIAETGRGYTAAAIAITAVMLGLYAALVMPLASGADLAPLVIAARLAALGRLDAIYAHDPGYVDMFDHDLWISTAEAVGYGDARYYVYLYPPLWAALLAPFACGAPFKAVFWIAGATNLAAIGLCVIIAAAQWNRAFLRPLPLVLCLVALCLSYPLFKTVLLGQMQPVVVLLVVVAIAASQNERPLLAGSTLALAAAIKLVPALIVVYWLFNGRRACAAWFAIVGAGLAALSLLLAGWDAHLAFAEALARMTVGHAVEVDNQALVAWLAEVGKGTDILHTIPIRPVPLWARLLVILFAASCAVALIRSAPRDAAAEALAIFALFLVATIASPFAWLHYFFCLAVPLVILARDSLARLVAIGIAALLSLPTLIYVMKNELSRASPLTWGGAIGALAVLALIAIAIRQAARAAAPSPSVASPAAGE